MQGGCGGLWCYFQRRIGWCRFRRSCPNSTQSIGEGASERLECEAHYGEDPRQKSGHLSRQASTKTSNVRPHLTALLWDNGEAQLLVVELEPDILAER